MAAGDSRLEVVVVEQSSAADRRRVPRYPSGRLSLVRAEGAAKPLARRAVVRDVSATGACLHIQWQYPEGTLLALVPLGWAGGRVLLARVVRCAPEGEGWSHGCEFTEPLVGFELEHWRRDV